MMTQNVSGSFEVKDSDGDIIDHVCHTTTQCPALSLQGSSQGRQFFYV